jgi:hypothetical protein
VVFLFFPRAVIRYAHKYITAGPHSTPPCSGTLGTCTQKYRQHSCVTCTISPFRSKHTVMLTEENYYQSQRFLKSTHQDTFQALPSNQAHMTNCCDTHTRRTGMTALAPIQGKKKKKKRKKKGGLRALGHSLREKRSRADEASQAKHRRWHDSFMMEADDTTGCAFHTTTKKSAAFFLPVQHNMREKKMTKGARFPKRPPLAKHIFFTLPLPPFSGMRGAWRPARN